MNHPWQVMSIKTHNVECVEHLAGANLKEGPMLTCKRCGHKWTPRVTKDKPAACPACKSYQWETEKKAEKR